MWLGYVDAQGSGSQRVVQPVSLVGGFLQGYDERRGENRTFAVHRITSVALVEEDQERRRGALSRGILRPPDRRRSPSGGRPRRGADAERGPRWPPAWRRR